jgi:hypothetical protein
MGWLLETLGAVVLVVGGAWIVGATAFLLSLTAKGFESADHAIMVGFISSGAWVTLWMAILL